MPDVDGTGRLSRERDIHRRLVELSAGEPNFDDFALFSDILRTFLAESPQLVARLADAIGRERVGDVEQTAHLLKGAAANVGATAFASLVEAIEENCRTGFRTGLGEDLVAVRTELAAFNRAAQMVADDLDQRPSTTAPTYPTLASSWSHA